MIEVPAHTPQSGLAAIGLVIRSKDGPRFVFHYPPHPPTLAPKHINRYGTELSVEPELDHGAEDEDDSDLEDAGYQIHPNFAKMNLNDGDKSNGRKKDTILFPDELIEFPDGERLWPWDRIGEFMTTDLESILTPSRAFHKKRFILGLDPLHFVSYPIHIREDGTWKKKKAKKSKKSKEGSEDGSVIDEKKDDKVKGKATGSEDGDDHGGMTMFNVVFMLSLPIEEEDARIAEMYDHVIKKFNKALAHAQASSDYVWKESELILSMKEKAREDRRPMSWLWSNILVKSTLAVAIKDVYNGIANSDIATVRLATNPALELSLQIPVPPFLLSLPGPTEKSMPGLLVTTANPMLDEEGNFDPDYLSKHFALLLLDDEDRIVNQLQHDNSELIEPVLEYIQMSKPTLSFLQVAQANAVELHEILLLAQHLIYWRKAIAIPPLHQRDTYIVNPNADHHKLKVAQLAWSKRFPLSLSLPNFLARISAAPRPYKTFLPSKAHRGVYLEMLGWLIRGGWVTRLHTFAYLKIWPEIIYEVEYQMKADEIHKRTRTYSTPGNTSSESNDESNSDVDKENDPSAPLTTEQAAEHARLDRLAAKEVAENQLEAAEFAKKPMPIATEHPSINNSEHLHYMTPYIIVDPHKISHQESMYISALGKRFEDPKLKEAFFKFLKYFNGMESLEMMPLKEGMKRKEAWSLIQKMDEHILIVRHW
ncbi:nitrogen permease regulator of amino acid transport activity 3-domain-containing protein [Bisporella sp. PMI_857]|nr:nitrogen permease regulator of amino acid transport activity 3-domain-containing protein [Bisporella sp. PMI_857]